MEDSDIVTLDSLAEVRSITTRTSRRVIAAAALSGPVMAAVIAGATYALYGPGRLTIALICGAVFVVLGLIQSIHWIRHYKAIFKQLEELKNKVAQGQVIYSSQVSFHSYR
ncbi:hypothetical protein [Cognatiluteimonas weifangensis]|uniref:hypothetical protein n=1 Tax=Cognatiluteimonas weifangensis TaxID=2303539 RepID=UPI0011C18C92|nr:hypothetical protein [Luteimonas weifangensis]